MTEGGYIKINRGILEWEWYGNINTKVLFLHMLIKANWKEGKFQGIDIPRGSFVSSYPKLSDELGLTVNEIRTALKHLQSTEEITVKAYSKFSVFTVNNYCSYQDINSQCTDNSQSDNSQSTVNAQSINSQLTTIEEGKKGRREKGKKGRSNIYTEPEKIRHKRGEYGHVLLSDEQIERLGKDYGEDMAQQAIQFLDEYMQMHGKSYKDCNLAIRKWVIDAVKKKGSENIKPVSGSSSTADKQQQSREMMYNWAMSKEGQDGG
ncbi:MAG TPA: hypothetical protein DC053_23510 [Lachnoclostridium sp.]|nr:hypothetical protein [Lachnoclostridium sp.]